jgi:hypothetical protein
MKAEANVQIGSITVIAFTVTMLHPGSMSVAKEAH